MQNNCISMPFFSKKYYISTLRCRMGQGTNSKPSISKCRIHRKNLSTNPPRAVKPDLLKNSVRFPQLHAHTTHPPTNYNTTHSPVHYELGPHIQPQHRLVDQHHREGRVQRYCHERVHPEHQGEPAGAQPNGDLESKKDSVASHEGESAGVFPVFRSEMWKPSTQCVMKDRPPPIGGRNFRQRLRRGISLPCFHLQQSAAPVNHADNPTAV